MRNTPIRQSVSMHQGLMPTPNAAFVNVEKIPAWDTEDYHIPSEEREFRRANTLWDQISNPKYPLWEAGLENPRAY